MKNITISMDEKLASAVRIEAAKAGMSVSKYLADAIREKLDAKDRGGQVGLNPQLEAIRRFLDGPELNISENGRMPTAEERNSRVWQRDIR